MSKKWHEIKKNPKKSVKFLTKKNYKIEGSYVIIDIIENIFFKKKRQADRNEIGVQCIFLDEIC
jgi:hypothetical protein